MTEPSPLMPKVWTAAEIMGTDFPNLGSLSRV